MKSFLQRHKIALVAVTGVLCIGLIAGFIISGTIRSSMAERSFTTVAEAKEETAAQEPNEVQTHEVKTDEVPEVMPTPSPAPAPSLDQISRVAQEVETRRRTIIPVRTNVYASRNTMFWTEEQASAEDVAAAQKAVDEWTQTLYGKSYEELTEQPVTVALVQRFRDPEGDRDTILRVTDPDGIYQVTVRASDMKLICADLLTYPGTVTTDLQAEAMKLAEKLGYGATSVNKNNSGERSLNEVVFMITTDKNECLAFSFCGDKLWQAAIYPNREAMLECEYFLADVQFDSTIRAYPESFVEAEAPKLPFEQMLPGEKIVIRLKRLYNLLSGDSTIANSDQIKATFFRDESGAREDCWKITGEGFDVTVSAYSRSVIRFKANIPCKDLLPIPYEEMGGQEYEDVTRLIGEELFARLGICDESGDAHGKAVKNVDANAVYDDHYCTMDVELADGSIYECYFQDGVLREIWYYADSTMMWVGGSAGWVADSVYVNTATGKKYIPDYRGWDGDLHVLARPEN